MVLPHSTGVIKVFLAWITASNFKMELHTALSVIGIIRPKADCHKYLPGCNFTKNILLITIKNIYLEVYSLNSIEEISE